MLCAACIINLHVALLDVSFILSFFLLVSFLPIIWGKQRHFLLHHLQLLTTPVIVLHIFL